ncbi:hypothetical protein TWF192_005958 [Orbilia oligospora]|uniref:Uncharacterized protein n=1 Tax=Orbilia oligospora TaxID=2813651 RepID=A0A6G1MNC3_ORBOL|nr:hypothetical protein TWF191_001357 [Orbilia oligospora]KAF3263684.1 hypothetical protein TWF192_005958 [Orbilia oligospora]
MPNRRDALNAVVGLRAEEVGFLACHVARYDGGCSVIREMNGCETRKKSVPAHHGGEGRFGVTPSLIEQEAGLQQGRGCPKTVAFDQRRSHEPGNSGADSSNQNVQDDDLESIHGLIVVTERYSVCALANAPKCRVDITEIEWVDEDDRFSLHARHLEDVLSPKAAQACHAAKKRASKHEGETKVVSRRFIFFISEKNFSDLEGLNGHTLG